ncbi:MAG: hypothetical protein VKN13_02680 [Cyanobacteriota bacterium]|nr:hypothetical protein [Cyanobacteriota bacterium]
MIRTLLPLALLLAGCLGPMPRPEADLDRLLEQAGARTSPSLGGRWLALIGRRQGRDQVQLIDLQQRLPVPVPGLNRADAQPLSVAVDQRGERLAVVRQRQEHTELLLYRRSVMGSEPIPLEPAGVPRLVAIQADGRQLAVQVSRNGHWQVDLIPLP